MDQFTHITISIGTLIKVALVALAFYLAYFFIDLILIVLTAIVLASAVEPAVQRLQRFQMPRMLAVLSVFALGITALTILGFTILPSLASETVAFIKEFPQYLQDTNLWFSNQAEESEVLGNWLGLESDLSLEQIYESISQALGFAASGVGNLVGFLFGSILNLVLILVLAFYFAAQEYGIDNFLKIVVPPKHSKYAINLWRRSQHKIGLWMQGQLVIMLLTGTIVYIGLQFLGLAYPFLHEYALVLATIAALAELVPVVGAFVSAIPAVALALIGAGPMAALWVALFYLVYQQIQGNVIYPMVVNKVVGVPPLLVLIGLIVGAQLFGILGAILSVPIAAAFMEFVKDVEKKHAQEIMRRKKEENDLAEKIAEKVVEKSSGEKINTEKKK
ncbi:MAG: AI-2E family transporter [Patescibacteria group bacterium]